jgi:hypothetical protein
MWIRSGASARRWVGLDLRSETSRSPSRSSYALAIAHYVSGVRTGRFEGPDILDGYACAAVIEAAEISARSGRTEDVPVITESTE